MLYGLPTLKVEILIGEGACRTSCRLAVGALGWLVPMKNVTNAVQLTVTALLAVSFSVAMLYTGKTAFNITKDLSRIQGNL